ncbi:MAG: NAD(P)/FAD-dependent oxidoreductase [Prevotella sp.]|nr:NAD(P)/FAD-dependent oxidoreductase [Prevotella sp.]
MKYDVVIIGSGLGGLICGRQLARSGRHVVVLERQHVPGGCLQSYQRGSMDFDTGLHYVGGLAEGQPLHDDFETLGLLQLPWQRLDPDGFDQIMIGQQVFPLAEGFDRFAETLSSYFPHQHATLLQFVDLLLHMPPMAKSMSVNAYDYLSSLFSDPLLVSVVSAAAMKLELRRQSLPLFTFVHCLNSYIQSSWRLRGGGNMIVQSLVRDILSAGGELCCHAEVKELREKGNRIASAHCKDGRCFEGDLFISDVHPQLTFGWMVGSATLKRTFLRRIGNMENTHGMFTVSLVLKPGVLPYFNHNKYIYRQADVWTLTEGTDSVGGVMVSARVPDDNSDYVRQVDLMTPMTWAPCKAWSDTTVGRRGEAYERLKERMAYECITLAERAIPGLHAMVERVYTSTPLTWRDYTLSPLGSAFGIRKDCRNPLMTMLSPRTPIANLFLTGQSLAMHGVEGVTKTAFNTLITINSSDI